jgi:hypothetical protein
MRYNIGGVIYATGLLGYATYVFANQLPIVSNEIVAKTAYPDNRFS